MPSSPESVSLALNWFTTSALYQPLTLGSVVGPTSLMTGAVLSILKAALVLAAAVLPARSVQLLESTVTAVPSLAVVFDWTRSPLLAGKAARQLLSRPESVSLALNWLTTSALYQPLTLGSVVGPASLMTGAVLSMLIPVAVAESLSLPAVSVQVPLA